MDLRPGPIIDRLGEAEYTVAVEDLLKQREATLKNRGVHEVNRMSKTKANYGTKSVKRVQELTL